MKLNHNLSYAMPDAVWPSHLPLQAVADGTVSLTDSDDALLDSVRGVAPGFPEAYASKEARDVALGCYGNYVKFFPTTAKEAEVAGFEAKDVAIGHRLGELGFGQVAPHVLDAVARDMALNDGSGSIVIARTRYGVNVVRDGHIAVSACPEFGVNADEQQIETTMRWLQVEFRKRLA